jgi:hypothetical protein
VGCALLFLGCRTAAPGGSGVGDVGDETDPLAIIEAPLPAESWDAIHREVIRPSCASTEAFCHHGQFEPNLSTPSLAYLSLVRRPGIELFDRYRIDPGNSAGSLLMNKLRGTAGVATIMPLGAPPLSDDDLARVAQWIDSGALRHPEAEPAPSLNEPPMPPEIAVFDASGERTSVAAVGETLRLRHSVRDFETPDDQIAFGAFLLQTAEGANVVLDPAFPDGVTPTMYDPAGPAGVSDDLSWLLDWTVPEVLTLVTFDAPTTLELPAAGQRLTLIALYLDELPELGGILTFGFELDGLEVQP